MYTTGFMRMLLIMWAEHQAAEATIDFSRLTQPELATR